MPNVAQLYDLRGIEREELHKKVVESLLQAIVVKLEKIEEILSCLQRSLEHLK